jgi:hypothetical protein
LYVPTPQGHGRIDNPEHYVVLYVSDDPAGAIGEAFGNHSRWTPELLLGPPVLPKSVRALATYELARPEAILDLDDAASLLDRALKPSRVVTSNRSVTQRWALAIYDEGRWAGIRWWSHWHAEWGAFGLWDLSELEVVRTVPLADAPEEVITAGEMLNRPWQPR